MTEYAFPLGGNPRQALESLGVPSYVLDTRGVIRWLNPAAERLVGDVRGRHFTSVVAPEDRSRAVELFTRKVLGTTRSTDATGHVVSSDGSHRSIEISAVPLKNGGRIVGVFGMIVGPTDKEAPAPHPSLTPRQAEVLRLLDQGRSTREIAQELHVTTETVRSHVRSVFRGLGVHSRLEAVAAVHAAAA